VSVFDLLFLVLALAAIGTLLTATVLALRGRGARARGVLRRLGVAAAVYFLMIVIVSAITPQRYARVGDDRCADDWCIAVAAVQRDTTRDAIGYDVTFRLASRARRVVQREHFVGVHLQDQSGRRYDPVADPRAVPFDTLLGPGESIMAHRRFVVPAGADIVGLVVTRDGGGRFPGCCIIGNEGSLFHRHTLIRLD